MLVLRCTAKLLNGAPAAAKRPLPGTAAWQSAAKPISTPIPCVRLLLRQPEEFFYRYRNLHWRTLKLLRKHSVPVRRAESANQAVPEH